MTKSPRDTGQTPSRIRRSSLTAISLFSGAGGMDIGVTQAGFSVLAAIEIDPFCCETLRANVLRAGRKTHVLEADVREVDPNDLMKELELKSGQLSLLFGGPPCQSFSQIGKQLGLKDERGLLLFQMIRYAAALKPAAVMIENVKGLLSATGKHGERGEVFELLLAQLDDLGYVPKWQIVNAADYGVPQLRKRVFIVATPKPNGFNFPLATHGPADQLEGLFPLMPYTTAGDVLRGLGSPGTKSGPVREDSHVDVTPAGDRSRINGVPEGGFLAAQTHLPVKQRKNLTHKDTTKFLRLSRKRPSNTLRCGEIFFHPSQDRYLTPREYMRIHGFPDDYLLKGPIRGRSGQARFLDQHRQVANSVVPPVAQKIAEEITKVLYAKNI